MYVFTGTGRCDIFFRETDEIQRETDEIQRETERQTRERDDPQGCRCSCMHVITGKSFFLVSLL